MKPTMSISEVAPGQYRVTIGESAVEILAKGHVYIVATHGPGLGDYSMTYRNAGTFDATAPVAAVVKEVPITAGEPTSSKVPSPASPTTAPQPRRAIPAKKKKPKKRAQTWKKWIKERIDAKPEPVAERAPKRRVKHHPLGQSASGFNNPVRYAVAKLRRTWVPYSRSRLDTFLGKVRTLTLMDIRSNEGETMVQTYDRAQSELEAWFETYCSVHGIEYTKTTGGRRDEKTRKAAPANG